VYVFNCLKKLHLVKVGSFVLDTATKFVLFSVSGLKVDKVDKKQAYRKTEACKLYSRVGPILDISAKCHQN